MDTTTLFVSMIFGAVGLALFLYGKKAQRMPHLAAGISLMICPYFIPNVIALTCICLILSIIPFVLREI